MLDLRIAPIVGGPVLARTPAKAEAVAMTTLSPTFTGVFIQQVSVIL